MTLVFLLALAALALVLLLRVRVTESETRTREQVQGLRRLVIDLEREVVSLKRRVDADAAGPAEARAPLDLQPRIEEQLEPKPAPAPVTPVETRPLQPAAPVMPAPPAVAAPAGHIRKPSVPVPPAAAAERPALAMARAATPPPSPPASPPRRPAPPAGAWSFDWESLVGVKLFSWIAGIALVVAGLFFLRYSIEQGWLQPPVRMAIGILVSLALLIVCEMRAAREYRVTANALDAAAVAILFSTFYAAYERWHLIGVTLAFFLLALVAAVAVLLSIRRHSLFIALLGLVGGCATPALVSTGQDNPFGLFGYLLILNAGLAWVAYRKTWPLLVGLSLAFTTFYQWSWVLTFLTDAKLLLAAGIFLVFAALSAIALVIGQPEPRKDGRESFFDQMAGVSACLPLLFALYLAASPAYAAHAGLLFSFVLVLDIGLFALAAARGPEILHVVSGAATLIVAGTWVSAAYGAGVAAWPTVLVFIVLVVAFYLAAPFVARRVGRTFTQDGAYGVLAAPILLFLFPVLAAVEPACADPGVLFAVLFGLLAGIAWTTVVTGRVALHFIAACFALAAGAVWSAKYLTPERLLVAPVLYGAFGLFYLAAPVLARRLGRSFELDRAADRLPARSALFLGLGGHLFVLFAACQPQLTVPPWPMLVVVVVLDLAVAAAALDARRGELHLAAMAATQVIVIAWVAVARDAPWPAVAILTSGGFVALACAVLVVARRLALDTRLFDAAVVTVLILAQTVALAAGVQPASPGALYLAVAHVVFAAALLALAAWRRWPSLAIAGTVLPAVSVILWQAANPGAEHWQAVLLFALPVYLTFVAYPLVLGRRVLKAIEPYQAAVLASIPFFFVARRAMYDGGLGGIIGALPIAQAALMAVLLVQLLRLERPGERAVGRLALVAGTVLAFITLAIPLQLEKEWITIGWALEGAALAWLFVRIPHRGLFWSAVALLTTVFVRLALNPQVLVYQPRGPVPIWNWYLYTYMVSAASMMVAAWSLVKADDATLSGFPRAGTLLKAGGTILLFLLLNIEIADFFTTGETITFNFTATLAQDLTYTLGWGLFGVGLLIAGIVLRSHAARVAALALMVITVLKCFLHDLARLEGLYRVASFVGLAVCLALVAVVLQRFVLARPREHE